MPEPTEIQKRASMMQKANISKAKGHLAKAIDLHGKAVDAFNNMHKCMGKADGDSDKYMRALSSHLTGMADHHELAMHALSRADADADPSVSPKNSEGGDVPKTTTDSITIHPQTTMTEGSVEGSDYRGAGDSPYSAAAVAAEIAKAVAAAMEPVNERLAKATEDNAFMKGQMAVLERMPSGQSRPRMIPGMSGGGSEQLFGAGDPTAAVNKAIGAAYNQIDENDPDGTAAATARIIGLRAANPRLFGKSLTSGEVAPLVISR